MTLEIFTSNQPVFFKALVNGTGQSYFYELTDKYPWNFHVRKKLQGHWVFSGRYFFAPRDRLLPRAVKVGTCTFYFYSRVYIEYMEDHSGF